MGAVGRSPTGSGSSFAIRSGSQLARRRCFSRSGYPTTMTVRGETTVDYEVERREKALQSALVAAKTRRIVSTSSPEGAVQANLLSASPNTWRGRPAASRVQVR